MLIESKIVEFFWFLATFILFTYALLQKYRWKEGIHSKRNRRQNSYKKQDLPKNQFAIDDQGDQEEQQQCKSEEDLPQIEIQLPSIAQQQRSKLIYLINNPLLFASMSILCILNNICNIFVVVMIFIYFTMHLLIIYCKLTKSIILMSPHLCILAIFINYLIVL